MCRQEEHKSDVDVLYEKCLLLAFLSLATTEFREDCLKKYLQGFAMDIPNKFEKTAQRVKPPPYFPLTHPYASY